MIDYIHNNYSDNIVLSDIARSADIGEREVCAAFREPYKSLPCNIFLKYRIMQGADFLLKNPSKSISEIAGLCGFDSPSNFSKMF